MQGELTDSGACADLNAAKAVEWRGEGGDVLGHLANNQDFLGIGGEERRHCAMRISGKDGQAESEGSERQLESGGLGL